MSLRQAWFFNDGLEGDANLDGSQYFLIPNDCSVVYVTGCGGGSGGAYNTNWYNLLGGTGGGSASLWVRYPLAVTPGGMLMICVGRGGLGAYSSAYGVTTTSAAEPSGVSPNLEGLNTYIAGDIVGPEVTANVPRLDLGYAGDTGQIAKVGGNSVIGAGDWVFPYALGSLPLNLVGAFSNGEAGAVAGSNPSSIGKPGIHESTAGGAGASGQYDNSPFGPSHETLGHEAFRAYEDSLLLGAGGAGGGNPYGRGGSGGTPSSNGGAGGNASGYGAGAGGSAFLCAVTGMGTNGFVLLEY